MLITVGRTTRGLHQVCIICGGPDLLLITVGRRTWVLHHLYIIIVERQVQMLQILQ